MSLVSLPELLADAGKGRYAVGYYESWDVYTLEAVVAAAEAERSPVIIGIGGLSANHEWLRSTGIEMYGAVAERLAQRSSVPIGVLFNEADSLEEAKLAIGAGLQLGDDAHPGLADRPADERHRGARSPRAVRTASRSRVRSALWPR